MYFVITNILTVARATIKRQDIIQVFHCYRMQKPRIFTSSIEFQKYFNT